MLDRSSPSSVKFVSVISCTALDADDVKSQQYSCAKLPFGFFFSDSMNILDITPYNMITK